MAITATQTVLGLHVNQDSRCSIIKNVGGIVWLIRLGIVQITVVSATVVSFGFKQNIDVVNVMRIVGNAKDQD
jgi:hypothetical protein